MTLIDCEDADSWVGIFVDEFRAAARRARASRRAALHLCLAGGSTPGPIYRALAASPDPLIPVELWLGDERVVPPEDLARNGDMIARAFSGAPWPLRVRQWPASAFDEAAATAETSPADFESAARRDAAVYAARLVEAMGGAPVFDLAILGLGSDGHTASLFPGDAALAEASALTALAHAPAPPVLRMTLTYPALAGARRTLFAVGGTEKAVIVRALAAGDPALPASAAGGADRAIVYLTT
jgi:6-phosphogluconolactonase